MNWIDANHDMPCNLNHPLLERFHLVEAIGYEIASEDPSSSYHEYKHLIFDVLDPAILKYQILCWRPIIIGEY